MRSRSAEQNHSEKTELKVEHANDKLIGVNWKIQSINFNHEFGSATSQLS